jgi:GNAT superfamily N-acetyltransferase
MPLPDGFSLRRATPDDLAVWGEFSRRTFEATYGPHQPPERMARHIASRLNDDRLREKLADPTRTVWLAERGGVLVGFAMLHVVEPPPEVVASRPVEVERFYVDASHHGTGLAGALMTDVCQLAHAAGHDVAWLGVWEGNPRAIRFYSKQGFRIVGQWTYFFDDVPEADHLMARAL